MSKGSGSLGASSVPEPPPWPCAISPSPWPPLGFKTLRRGRAQRLLRLAGYSAWPRARRPLLRLARRPLLRLAREPAGRYAQLGVLR
eukprot:9456097-Heterocapsa_arctica.AAC.1